MFKTVLDHKSGGQFDTFVEITLDKRISRYSPFKIVEETATCRRHRMTSKNGSGESPGKCLIHRDAPAVTTDLSFNKNILS